ncbi:MULTISPECIES: hypothetical protein [Pseudomonas]|nr:MULTISPECIES: hypothetical protein [Pseudomonas]WRV66496.1 hypothetical protein VQ575_16580 [Pseudomonas frederiksbergensis]
MKNWDEAPLLRAAAKALDTAVQLKQEGDMPCGEYTLRYNVANIHEIKNIWRATAQEDDK